MKRQCELAEHTGDQVDSHGRCLGVCRECDEHLESTGRLTVYCPSCDVCPECGCPQVDGFMHYAGCADLEDDIRRVEFKREFYAQAEELKRSQEEARCFEQAP